MSHFVDPFPPLNVWRNLWMLPNDMAALKKSVRLYYLNSCFLRQAGIRGPVTSSIDNDNGMSSDRIGILFLRAREIAWKQGGSAQMKEMTRPSCTVGGFTIQPVHVQASLISELSWQLGRLEQPLIIASKEKPHALRHCYFYCYWNVIILYCINRFTSLCKNLLNLLEFLAEVFRCHVHHFQCLTLPVDRCTWHRKLLLKTQVIWTSSCIVKWI